jgi:hypothetical protein
MSTFQSQTFATVSLVQWKFLNAKIWQRSYENSVGLHPKDFLGSRCATVEKRKFERVVFFAYGYYT